MIFAPCSCGLLHTISRTPSKSAINKLRKTMNTFSYVPGRQQMIDDIMDAILVPDVLRDHMRAVYEILTTQQLIETWRQHTERLRADIPRPPQPEPCDINWMKKQVYEALLQSPKQRYLGPCKSTGEDITYVDTPVTQKGPHIILGCEQLGKTDEIAFIMWQSCVLNNRTPVLACKNMGGRAEVYKFVTAITALNDRVSEIVNDLRRQYPDQCIPQDAGVLHVDVSEYLNEGGEPKPIDKFLWRMEQQAQQTERMRPKPIIVLANHAQFKKLAGDIPIEYRSEMELVVDEAHKVHLSADQNLPSERYLFDMDAEGRSLIEDMSRAVFVTATAIDLYRIGSSTHNILEMPHPRNHVNWIDGWKQTECFKQFKMTVAPPDGNTSEDDLLEDADSSQPVLAPIEFELLEDPPRTTVANQPVHSNDEGNRDTSSDTEEPMTAPTRNHFRQKYMRAHLERFECESVDECDVRVYKRGAKKGLCQIKTGRTKSESVIRDINTPAEKEWKEAMKAFKKLRLKSSVRAVNRSRSLMTPKAVCDYVHSIAEKAFAQKRDAAEFRMLVNAHTELTDVKETLCEDLRKAPLLQSTFVFAHYAIRENWTISLHVPANYHQPFERVLRNCDVLFEHDTDRNGVVRFKTVNDVYSVLQHFQRVVTPGEGLRSICIDGKRGVEGVSYRPNDHSGHLTHAFFACSFNKDLTSLKQLLGRVNGIVKTHENGQVAACTYRSAWRSSSITHRLAKTRCSSSRRGSGGRSSLCRTLSMSGLPPCTPTSSTWSKRRARTSGVPAAESATGCLRPVTNRS